MTKKLNNKIKREIKVLLRIINNKEVKKRTYHQLMKSQKVSKVVLRLI